MAGNAVFPASNLPAIAPSKRPGLIRVVTSASFHDCTQPILQHVFAGMAPVEVISDPESIAEGWRMDGEAERISSLKKETGFVALQNPET